MKLARTALAIPALVLLAACGASSQGDSPTASADSVGEAPLAAPDLPRDELGYTDDGADGADGGATVGSTADGGSKSFEAPSAAVISRGQVSLESDDLDAARFDLQKLLDSWGGSIANEETAADEDGRTNRQRLDLRVPSDRFDTAMEEISHLGTLVDRSRTAEDVTTQVIDTDSRVRSQRLSLARIQALLAKATSLSQVIAIETQLSQRQAELDSLEQQQKYLADQTALATITVYLSAPEENDPGEDENSFGSGLESGWENLKEATTTVLQALGATVPFLGAAILLGAPIWLWRRKRAS